MTEREVLVAAIRQELAETEQELAEISQVDKVLSHEQLGDFLSILLSENANSKPDSEPDLTTMLLRRARDLANPQQDGDDGAEHTAGR